VSTHPLRDALLHALTVEQVRARLPERLRVQDLNDPVTARLVVSVWEGTVARVLARGRDLTEDDLPLAIEAVIAGVILKLEQALFPEQLGDRERDSLVAEYLALLGDVQNVSTDRATGTGRFAGGQPRGAFPTGHDPAWWQPVPHTDWSPHGAPPPVTP
jgi:hypothetical protein